MWWLVGLWVALVSLAHAELFDGVTGDELPTVTTCWGVVPPIADEDFAEATVFTHLDPFQCVVVARYHDQDPLPSLPGGFGFWTPHAAPSPCPAPQGQNVRVIVRDRRHYAIDSGCWVP